LKIQDGGGRHIGKSKNFKIQYLSNGLTDLYEIWRNDAEWSLNHSVRLKM